MMKVSYIDATLVNLANNPTENSENEGDDGDNKGELHGFRLKING